MLEINQFNISDNGVCRLNLIQLTPPPYFALNQFIFVYEIYLYE